MTSKERVFLSLAHKEPDRIPIYIWYHPEVLKRLEPELGCSGRELEIVLGNDILQTWVSINYFQSQVLEEGAIFIDEYGIKWHRLGGYNMIIENPLANQDVDNLGDYKFPDPNRNNRFTELQNIADTYGKEKFIGADVSGTIFEPCSEIRGLEQFLLDLTFNPDSVEPFLDNAMNFSLQVAKNSLDLNVDWIWLGDDLGTQNNMIISPVMWRRFFKPRMHKIISELREIKPDLIIAYHSCGSIRQIIGDLIELGINVLNPVQPKAFNMNPYQIKEQYGEKISLHCGIDTQDILPFASIPDLELEVKEIIKRLGKGGGLIFTASHTIQPDTTNERILLVLDTLKKYGKYPINI